MNADVVARLHEYLAQALERSRPDPFDQPITVAEIYQDLAPYRGARSSIGVELNQDYEHALVRLLSGEEGRVRLEPGTAREELQRELESPNPNVTLYRKFAACDVWVRPLPPEDASAPAAVAPDAEEVPEPWADAAVSSPAADAGQGAGAAAKPHRPPVPGPAPRDVVGRDDPFDDLLRDLREMDAAPAPTPPPEEAAPRPQRAACVLCGHPLPAGREARFCPRCGANQRAHPCPECGEVLEPEWRFCIRCGRDARPSGAAPA